MDIKVFIPNIDQKEVWAWASRHQRSFARLTVTAPTNKVMRIGCFKLKDGTYKQLLHLQNVDKISSEGMDLNTFKITEVITLIKCKLPPSGSKIKALNLKDMTTLLESINLDIYT